MRLVQKDTSRTLCSILTASLVLGTGGTIGLNHPTEVFAATTNVADAEFNNDTDINDNHSGHPYDHDVFYRNITQISLSETHAISLDKYGNAYTQGFDMYGQLGSGSAGSANDNMRAFDLSGIMPKLKKVWAFDNVSFFLAANNELYACGDNSTLQLGLETSDCMSPQKISYFSDNNINIIDIKSANGATFFLSDTGNLYACGDNYSGWFGIGDNIGYLTPQNLNIKNTVGTIADFAIGNDFAVIVNTNGEIFFAGNNEKGQCGFINMTNSTYTEFTKMPYTVSELDAGCYHDTCGISGYKVFAGGNMYSIAPGCHIDNELSDIYNMPIGEEIYPELLIFGLDKNLPTQYFLGVFDQPFQTEITTTDVNCKKITNFSTSSSQEIIRSVENVYHIENFTGISGENQNGNVVATALGTPQLVNWDYLEEIEGLLYSFPILKTHVNQTEIMGRHTEFSRDYLIVQATDTEETTNYVLVHKIEELENGELDYNPGYFSIIGPFMCLTEEDMQDNFFRPVAQTVKNPVFEQESTTLDIGTEKTLKFETYGNSNFEFCTTTDSIFTITNISPDKREITVKGINTGTGTLNAISFDANNNEKIVDSTEITVAFNKEQFAASFDKPEYSLTEGDGLYVEFDSAIESDEISFEIEDDTIASINQFMNVTGLKSGQTRLLAKYKGEIIASSDIYVFTYGELFQIVCREANIAAGTTANISEFISVIPTSAITNLRFASENPTVCTVSEDGNLKAISAGETQIKITHTSGEVHYLDIKVFDGSIGNNDTKITVNTSEYKLRQGEQTGLNISVSPQSEINNIQLKSQDETVCIVDKQNMLIKAVGKGETYIEITHPSTGTINVKVTVTDSIVVNAPKTKKISVGSRVSLGETVSPASEKNNITYQSDNTSVCSVTNNGTLQGISVGNAVISILHNGELQAKTEVTVVEDVKTDETKDKPNYTISNSLNNKGDLDVIIGATTSLNIRLNGVSGQENQSKYKPKIRIKSGQNRIDVDSTDDAYKFEITGLKKGSAQLEIYSKDRSIEPLVIDIDVDYAKLSDTAGVGSSTWIDKDTGETKEDTTQQTTSIPLGSKHILSINGLSGIDAEKFFDVYFDVSATGDTVKYLGDGVVEAVKPGVTTMTIKSKDNKKQVGKIRYSVPFPQSYFTEYPSNLIMPKGRTIEVRFNHIIKASTVTNASVFVQSANDGNGTSLDAKVNCSGQNIKIQLLDKDIAPGKYYVFFTEEIKDRNGNDMISPVVMPINIIDTAKF